MPRLQSIVFSTEGWTLAEESDSTRKWRDAPGDVLSFHYFDKQPNVPAALSDIAAIRNACRADIAHEGGGLVEVELDQLGGTASLRTILKFLQKPHGMTYVGAWTIPRRTFSFVIKICCAERGVTGLRDAFVSDRLLAGRTSPIDPAELMSEWATDPYDRHVRSPVCRNRSDDVEWDAAFPNHPLSRVRSCLQAIKETITLDESVSRSAPFEGPLPTVSRRSWWTRMRRER